MTYVNADGKFTVELYSLVGVTRKKKKEKGGDLGGSQGRRIVGQHCAGIS